MTATGAPLAILAALAAALGYHTGGPAAALFAAATVVLARTGLAGLLRPPTPPAEPLELDRRPPTPVATPHRGRR